MRRIVISLALVVASASAAAAYPVPHTPCWAIAHDRAPAAHMRYWNAAGWRMDTVGRWTTHGGAGCWGDP